ncbi:hypothetical protein AaE_012933, partial [Aphanomyces astaci]
HNVIASPSMGTSVIAMPRASTVYDSMSIGSSNGILYQRRWLQAARCSSGSRVPPSPPPPKLRKRTTPSLHGHMNPRSSSFTMPKGQYIAPEKIENVLHTSWFVAQAIVFGDDTHEALVAMIVPEDYALIGHVLQDIAVVSKEGKLCSFETVRAITLLPTHFTSESGLLQRNRKVDRNVAKALFQAHVDSMFTTADDHVCKRRYTQTA